MDTLTIIIFSLVGFVWFILTVAYKFDKLEREIERLENLLYSHEKGYTLPERDES